MSYSKNPNCNYAKGENNHFSKLINEALLKLTFNNHQDVIRIICRDIPVIEVKPGFVEHEEVKNGYKIATYSNCRVILK